MHLMAVFIYLPALRRMVDENTTESPDGVQNEFAVRINSYQRLVVGLRVTYRADNGRHERYFIAIVTITNTRRSMDTHRAGNALSRRRNTNLASYGNTLQPLPSPYASKSHGITPTSLNTLIEFTAQWREELQ